SENISKDCNECCADVASTENAIDIPIGNPIVAIPAVPAKMDLILLMERANQEENLPLGQAQLIERIVTLERRNNRLSFEWIKTPFLFLSPGVCSNSL
ncbi:12385_t:CDS:2, partial [Dentiscutata heterogama]